MRGINEHHRGAQTNGPGSQLIANGGIVTLGTDAGYAAAPNLSVTVNAGTAVGLDGTQHLAALAIAGGNRPAPLSGHLISTNALAITGGGKLVLYSDLIVHGGSLASAWNGTNYTGITGRIQRGGNGGQGSGPGIEAFQGPPVGTLAVASDADLGKSTFDDVHLVGPTDILLKYTFAGDANLDGKIDADDYFQIDSNYDTPPTSLNYYKGDFNYDGVINGDDGRFFIDLQLLQPIPIASSLAAGGRVARSRTGNAAGNSCARTDGSASPTWRSRFNLIHSSP